MLFLLYSTHQVLLRIGYFDKIKYFFIKNIEHSIFGDQQPDFLCVFLLLLTYENKRMDYQNTIEYLYGRLPVFQRIGKAAYKSDLKNTHLLDQYFGHPHKNYKTIHIAGTNGKGSVSHMLASVLQEAGYKTGLYTSPHLIDFRERIRINGEMVSKEYVIDFIEKHKEFI